jgi:hypothetical protein
MNSCGSDRADERTHGGELPFAFSDALDTKKSGFSFAWRSSPIQEVLPSGKAFV